RGTRSPGSRPTWARTASRRPRAGPSRASRASARSAARSGSRRPRLFLSSARACTPRGDPPLGGRPTRVEGVPRLVEVDHQWRVVGGDGLAFARLAVDLRPHRAPGVRAGRQQVIDAHAEVLVEVAGAVVPPRVAAGLGMVLAIHVDQPPAAEPREGVSLRW